MKILFLTQVLPYPLDAGPKVRAYYVLRYLAQHHEVTLVSFVRPTDTPEAVEHLRAHCRAVYTVPMRRSKLRDVGHLAGSLVSGAPFIIARDWVNEMAQTLGRLAAAEPFEAVHADQLWMAPYALWLRDHAPWGRTARLALDQHNAVYRIPERMAAGERNPAKLALFALEARKLRRYEGEICRRFDHVAWVTAEDYAAVQAASSAPVPNSGVIPICGDPEEETPARRGQDARRVTFLGGMHYPPNAQGIAWFAEAIFPKVLAAAPDALLTVIGKQPPALHQAAVPAANLDVRGYVDDPRPLLDETAVFIVPLLAGGGMRVKIIDAWTWALPVVSTAVGAEGIEFTRGVDLLVADQPDDFARSVVKLLQDPHRASQLAAAGRAAALRCYNWRTRYSAWDTIYPLSG